MTTAPPEVFLLALFAGAVSMALWDVLHGLRRVIFRGVIGNFVLDMLWQTVTLLLFFGTVWKMTEWRLRSFEVFAWGTGAALWHFTAGRYIRRGSEMVFGIILKIFGIFFKILLTPAQFLYKILLDMCRGMIRRSSVYIHNRRRVKGR